jgi:gamma-glutamyltranspeptidase
MIVTGTAQMVVNLIDYNATPQQVVSLPRIHTEGEEPIQVSNLLPAVVDELRKRGHKVDMVPYLGGESNAAVIDLKTGNVEAAASGKPPGVLLF